MSDKIKKNNLNGTGESGRFTYGPISSDFLNKTPEVNNDQIKNEKEPKDMIKNIKKDNNTEKN